MRKDRYSGYRGRLSATDWLRRIALALVLLVVVAGGALIAGQRYIVYTDNGLRMDLPFGQQDRSEEELEDITVVVEPEVSDQSQPEEPPQEQPEVPLRAIALSVESLLDGTALQQVQAAGANAVILDMKDDKGSLGFVSGNAVAVEIGANSAAEGINQAIAALAQEDIHLIARVSCFRDHRLSGSLTYAIETNPGRRWTDLDGVRWSNPAKPAVQEYLGAIVKELSELGFDEILLDHWGYPTRQDGRLDYIKKGEFYVPDQLETAIGAFLTQMQSALEGSSTKLSLYCGDGVLQGLPDQSGRALEQLGSVSGRVWLEDGEDAAQLPEETQVVKLVSAFVEEDADQALWNAER